MMVEELRRRLLALGYEFVSEDEDADEDAIFEENETLGENETLEESETPEDSETPALCLALRRALAEVRRFCNLLEWPEVENVNSPFDVVWQWPWELREAFLDLAAAGFLQSKMALAPESLAVMPTLTSLKLGDAAWSFGGGTQRSGTDALTRTENLTAELRRQARAALCGWRSIC